MELPQPLHSRSPLDVAADREKSEAVRNALGALPANQRIAIILRYFEGLGAADIARSLETTPKAVERLLHRARGALESLLCEVE
jgi:RNA polymerase sigma-70 factor (ECF subfamily)